MKKLLLLLLSVLSLTTLAQDKKTVAVLNPVCRDSSTAYIYFSIVRGSFETVASSTEGYEAYDRTALDQILNEQNFQRSGIVNETQIRELGIIAGVDYVLVTEISADEGYLMVIAKILNVETAKYDCSVDDLMEMSPPKVKAGCTELAQKMFNKNMSTGNQKGEITYKGMRYIGEYQNGVPNGNGKIYFTDNNYYEGEWADGTPQGYGIWVNDDVRYEGFFADGKPHGNGKFFGMNGTQIEGNFSRGTITDGTFYFPSGDKYIGHLMDLLPYGQGTGYFSSGDKYVGLWKNGIKEGKGTYYYKDGKSYVGEFSNDKPNGEGTLYLQDGSRYIGTWVNGVMHGNFLIFLPDGTNYYVRFENGEPLEVINKK